MKKQRIVRYDPKKHRDRTDWDRVRKLTDEEIAAAVAADPDAPPLIPADWHKRVRLVHYVAKVPVSIRLDEDVLKWFKRQGPRYQSRMNAVLRAFVEAHRKRRSPG